MLISNLFSFLVIPLLLNSFFIFFFKKWLGPQGIFYISIINYLVTIVIASIEFYYILKTGSYFFIDFGRFILAVNLLDSHLVFCIDELALILTIMVCVLISFALFFGVEYMVRDAFIIRLLYLLNLFATSVILLFLSYDFFLILIAWELIGLFSYLLVNFYSVRVYTIKAALKTFVLSRISDMFLFIAFILIVLVFGTTDLSIIFLEIPFFIFHNLYILNLGVNFLALLGMLIVLASAIKAAQFLFHVWLPDAMEAPTPASALIHSSTLVIMGIYLIIRFNLIFEFSIVSNYVMALLGAVTIAFGAVSAIFQNDIKKLIAYSTISQIGYLMCGCGFALYDEVLIYLIIHAFNKAFLFILVGFIVHYFAGNTDMRQMGGIYMYIFDITVYVLILSINLAGLPYSSGFYAKEFIIFQLLKYDFISVIVQITWLLSFLFTPLYMFILLYFTLFNFKKANVKIYRGTWLIRTLTYFKLTIFKGVSKQYQLTILTSKLMVLILFIVNLMYTYLGDYLITVIFNVSTLNDSTQFQFNLINTKPTFYLNSFTTTVVNNITFIILTSFILIVLYLEKVNNNTKGLLNFSMLIKLLTLLLLGTLSGWFLIFTLVVIL